MAKVEQQDRAQFFKEVEAATKRAIWCALATNAPDGPRVRMVHPTWDGEVLWFATGPSTPKIRQIEHDPRVDVQFQVAPPDFVHLLVRGRATLVSDPGERKRVWDLLDYDLAQFWPGGPDDPGFAPVRIDPDRVELSKMFGSQDKRVWRRR